MFGMNFEEIGNEEIQKFLEGQFTELQRSEFKKESWFAVSKKSSDEQRDEMLKDITGMANAYGGYIFVGIKPNAEGKYEYFDVPDSEAEKDKILQICNECIQPRLSGLHIKPVIITATDGQKTILLLQVPQGANAPYAAKAPANRAAYWFWRRYGDQVKPMQIFDIRKQVMDTYFGAEALQKKLTDAFFEYKRVNHSVPPFIWLAAAPANAFSGNQINVKDPEIKRILTNQHFISSNDPFQFSFRDENFAFTLNGVRAKLYGTDIDRNIELYKNGYIQGVGSGILNARTVGQTKQLFSTYAVLSYLLSFVNQVKNLYQQVEIHDAVVFQVGVGHANTYYLSNKVESNRPRVGLPGSFFDERQYDEPAPLLSEAVYIDDFGESSVLFMADQLAEKIWNGFGFETAPRLIAEDMEEIMKPVQK